MRKLYTIVLALFVCCTIAFASGATEKTTSISEKVDGIRSVVLVVPSNLGDKGFSDLAYSGLLLSEQELGIKTRVVELAGDTTKQIPILREFAEDPDWDLIVSGTYSMNEAISTVAAEYPEKKFLVYDTAINYADGIHKNCFSFEHRAYESSFLAGALAASLTNKGLPNANAEKIVGFVGGMENASISDFLIGYIQGVQYMDPECKVLVSYVGSFTDTATAKEMTIAQCNKGADIVFAVAGGSSLGVLDGAAEKNVYSIGVDQDQYLALVDNNPKVASNIVTSVIKRLDVTIARMIAKACEGTLEWGTHVKVGLAEDSIGLANNEHYLEIVPEEVRNSIDILESKITDGGIVVETAIGMTTEQINAYKTKVAL